VAVINRAVKAQEGRVGDMSQAGENLLPETKEPYCLMLLPFSSGYTAKPPGLEGVTFAGEGLNFSDTGCVECLHADVGFWKPAPRLGWFA
jgi:hypothetical protein